MFKSNRVKLLFLLVFIAIVQIFSSLQANSVTIVNESSNEVKFTILPLEACTSDEIFTLKSLNQRQKTKVENLSQPAVFIWENDNALNKVQLDLNNDSYVVTFQDNRRISFQIKKLIKNKPAQPEIQKIEHARFLDPYKTAFEIEIRTKIELLNSSQTPIKVCIFKEKQINQGITFKLLHHNYVEFAEFKQSEHPYLGIVRNNESVDFYRLPSYEKFIPINVIDEIPTFPERYKYLDKQIKRIDIPGKFILNKPPQQ